MAEEKEKKQEEKKEKPKEEKQEEPKKEEKQEAQEKPKSEEKKEKRPKEKDTPKKPNYIHGALLLHSANKEINESNMEKVIEAAGVSPDQAQIKALVSSLEGVDIEEAISQSVAVAAPEQPTESKKAEKKEDPKKEEKKAEEAAAGLASLFG